MPILLFQRRQTRASATLTSVLVCLETTASACGCRIRIDAKQFLPGVWRLSWLSAKLPFSEQNLVKFTTTTARTFEKEKLKKKKKKKEK